MKEKTLQDLGLTKAEAKTYLTLLELGPSKTGILIEKTKLQSSTIYNSLNSLLEKGIITFILKGKIKYFQAEPPETLLKIHDEKKKNYLKILPELKQQQNKQKTKQTAKVFKGIKGLQTAYSDILNTMRKGEEYYFLQVKNEDLQNDELITFFRNYHLKRSEKGIKVKGLAMKKTEKNTKQIWENLKHTQIKYANEFLPTGMIIYKNKIIIIEWEDSPIAITIESQSIADSYKKFFLNKWNIIK